MGQYLPIIAMMALAVVFAGLSLVVSKLLAPNRSTAAKRAPYECGIVPGRALPERFPVHFYLVAMIFIVFDIEIIFLFPWAAIYRNIGGFGLVAIGLFTVPVIVGLLYEVSTGTFSWGERRHPIAGGRHPVETGPAGATGTAGGDDGGHGMISPERTAATTVRRVGLEGREEPPRQEPAPTGESDGDGDQPRKEVAA